MFHFKIILWLVAVTNCVLTSTCLGSEALASEVVDAVVSPNAAEGKINWTPVWEDNEGNNEFESRNFGADAEADQRNCEASHGFGLQNLFREVQKILPKDQIKAIAKSYSEDPEIKALKAFVSNPTTKELVKALRNSQDYQILRDYSCRVLHIDLIKYVKLARSIFQPLQTRTDQQPREGIRGLINEINSVLPRKQLRELYESLLASDDELAEAVANLKSKEYHQLLLNVRNNVPEYQELRQQLTALGVSIKELRDLLASTLGWAPELGVFA